MYSKAKRVLSLQQHQQIIGLFIQFFSNNHNQVHSKIGEITGLHRTTVRGVIVRYLQRGSIYLGLKSPDKPIGQKTQAITDYITDSSRLQAWGRFTIRERCVLIRRNLGVSIHQSFLRKLYIKNNIKYRQVKLEYHCSNYETIDDRRMQFALRLAQMIDDKIPIIYADETTFNYHLRQSKSWSKPNQKIVFELNNIRYSGCTVIGAIGTALTESLFMTAGSTNSTSFYHFLNELVTHLKPNIERPVLLLDNHAAHKTVINQELMNRYFTVIWMPPSSCEFNSIESLWSLHKQIFKRKIVNRVGKIRNQEQLDEEVRKAVGSVSESTSNKYLTSNREYLHKYLVMCQERESLSD